VYQLGFMLYIQSWQYLQSVTYIVSVSIRYSDGRAVCFPHTHTRASLVCENIEKPTSKGED